MTALAEAPLNEGRHNKHHYKTVAPPDWDWPALAACKGLPTDLFIPDKERGRVDPLAVQVCAHCDVRDECLQWALDNGEVGLWGGTTDNDRKKIRRAQENKPGPKGAPPPHHSEARAQWNRRHGQPQCPDCLKDAARKDRERRQAKRDRETR